MPYKEKNLELEYQGLLNPPEVFYFQHKHIIMISDELLSTPRVITHRVLKTSTVDKVFQWQKDNNLWKDVELKKSGRNFKIVNGMFTMYDYLNSFNYFFIKK